MKEHDVAIIGGGIVGLAHAWSAASRGLKVSVFERSSRAVGASVRNFGMIWPIGQTAGELYQAALRSREMWLELAENHVLEVESCGSIHLAHHQDEADLLQEFIEQGTHQAEWMSPQQVFEKSTIANPEGLLGGMYSPTELRVDPRTASAKIAQWLQSEWGVEFHFDTLITQIDGTRIVSSEQEAWSADRILICSGSDLKTLYPEQFAKSGLKLCKLQMLRTVPQKTLDEQKNAHIASGIDASTLQFVFKLQKLGHCQESHPKRKSRP